MVSSNAKDAVLRLNNFEFLAKKAKVILKDSNVIIKKLTYDS